MKKKRTDLIIQIERNTSEIIDLQNILSNGLAECHYKNEAVIISEINRLIKKNRELKIKLMEL